MFSKVVSGGFASVLILTVATFSARAGIGGVDSTFNPTANGAVYSILNQTNGEVIIGGVFNMVNHTNRFATARLFSNGSLDTTFTNSLNANAAVYAMLQQPDGKIIVGGSFNTRSNGQNIARLNADGSVDSTFSNVVVNTNVTCLALQTDGKILIGGRFTSINSSNRNYIARLNSDGSPDFSFDAGAIFINNGSGINAIAVQSDGNILIGGTFTYFGTYNAVRTSIARLQTNGALDLSYVANANNNVLSFYLEPGDKLVAGGYFTSINTNHLTYLARINPDGSVDAGFTPTGSNNLPSALTEDSSGNIYSAGFNYNIGNSDVVRLSSAGVVDPTYNNVFTNAGFNTIAVGTDGKATVGGGFNSAGGYAHTNLARLYANFFPADISVQPLSQVTTPGNNITFTVQVSNPTPVTYQWLKNGTNITGATSNQYTVTNVQFGDAGNYSVLATSDYGSSTSSNALLQVGYPPVITQSPTNLALNQGSSATFTVTASGSPLSYHWYYGSSIVGTNSSYSIPYVSTSVAGIYTVVVSNFFGGITSAPATLVVYAPVGFYSQSGSISTSVGNNCYFIATAYGNPISYQWYQNGNPILQATNNALYFTNVTFSQAGSYYVVISNQLNMATSSVATLTVGLLPSPLTIHLNPDLTVTLHTTGTPGFSYGLETTASVQPHVTWSYTYSAAADTNGLWTYTDTNPATSGSRYYRMLTQ